MKQNVISVTLFDVMKNDIKKISDELTKIRLGLRNVEVARDLSSWINTKWKKDVKSYVFLTEIEIVPINVDKGNAIDIIIQKENIAKQDVYTIGDGANDVEMILKYNGYGMKHADDSIYKVTNKLCGGVKELIEIITEHE